VFEFKSKAKCLHDTITQPVIKVAATRTTVQVHWKSMTVHISYLPHGTKLNSDTAAEERWCSKIMHGLTSQATATGYTKHRCGLVFQDHDHYTVVKAEKYRLSEAMVGNYCVLLQWYKPSKVIMWPSLYTIQNCNVVHYLPVHLWLAPGSCQTQMVWEIPRNQDETPWPVVQIAEKQIFP
jgi:hypothetical protein